MSGARPLRCPRALGPLTGHLVAAEAGEVIIDRPVIREPDLGVRAERRPRGIQPRPRLRDASGQEKPPEADTGICGHLAHGAQGSRTGTMGHSAVAGVERVRVTFADGMPAVENL